MLHIPSYLLPMPSEIFTEIYDNAGVLARNGQATLVVIVTSFVASVLVGVPLALLISFSSFARRAIYPLIVFSQMIPKIAIAPLFVIWFGFGFTPKLLIAVLISFFAVVIQSIVGFTSLSPQPVRVARSMGATPLDLFFKVRLPHALPNIFAGLKMAMASSAIGAIVGEFIASQQGLGYLVLVANGQMNTKLAFAGMLILSVMGIVLYFLVEVVERLATGWRSVQRN
ncbi:ABC transporter permease [Burkholderia sp. Ac-20365]|nr:ABC transporter permease [Burkholderia sp. Ac-20365]